MGFYFILTFLLTFTFYKVDLYVGRVVRNHRAWRTGSPVQLECTIFCCMYISLVDRDSGDMDMCCWLYKLHIYIYISLFTNFSTKLHCRQKRKKNHISFHWGMSLSNKPKIIIIIIIIIVLINNLQVKQS